MFRAKKKIPQKPAPRFRLRIVMVIMCASLAVMQPRAAQAQVGTISHDPLLQAWNVANAAAQQLFQHAENLISWMVTSSGLSGVIGGLEIQVEAMNRQTQAKLDHEKLMHSADPAAAAAAKAAPSPNTVACATQYAGYTRNGAGNAVGGLVKMVTAVVASKGRATPSANGSTAAPDAASVAAQVQTVCEQQGQGYSFFAGAPPCPQQ